MSSVPTANRKIFTNTRVSLEHLGGPWNLSTLVNTLWCHWLSWTRNLAIANRSRLGYTHKVTTVVFQEGGGRKHCGTPLLAAAAISIKFHGGGVFHGGNNICDTLRDGRGDHMLPRREKITKLIYIPHVFSTPPSGVTRSKFHKALVYVLQENDVGYGRLC